MSRSIAFILLVSNVTLLLNVLFLDEEIDGECLLKLQESHLSSFQFKAGTRMKLLSFIDKMRELQSHSETLRLTESDSICGAVSTGKITQLFHQQQLHVFLFTTGMHSSDISIMSTVPNADSSRATTSNGDSEKVFILYII